MRTGCERRGNGRRGERAHKGGGRGGERVRKVRKHFLTAYAARGELGALLDNTASYKHSALGKKESDYANLTP